MTGKSRQQNLFDLGEGVTPEPALKRPRYPVWTENKAKLIQTYLRLFVMITKHGVYIDAFAGPQEPDKHEMWAAKLVLETYPRWFRKFYLFELDEKKVALLEKLREQQPPKQKGEAKRVIKVFSGDVNKRIQEVLNTTDVKLNDATFCLLDQRTFECDWETVRKIALYKAAGNKIELFYFLPMAWLDRALNGLKGETKKLSWWGNADWEQLRLAKGRARASLFEERFRSELGYKSAKAWPIYGRPGGRGRIMYYMIHATDHPEAPMLMSRAYGKAVNTEQEFEQLALELTGKS